MASPAESTSPAELEASAAQLMAKSTVRNGAASHMLLASTTGAARLKRLPRDRRTSYGDAAPAEERLTSGESTSPLGTATSRFAWLIRRLGRHGSS
jgi:hypothetical protein